ncbi:hypothetical protein Nmel_015255 [Mimus melanotis]
MRCKRLFLYLMFVFICGFVCIWKQQAWLSSQAVPGHSEVGAELGVRTCRNYPGPS